MKWHADLLEDSGWRGAETHLHLRGMVVAARQGPLIETVSIYHTGLDRRAGLNATGLFMLLLGHVSVLTWRVDIVALNRLI